MRDLKGMVGSRMSSLRGLASSLGGVLFGFDGVAFARPPMSLGMLFGENRALLEGAGHALVGLRQARGYRLRLCGRLGGGL